MKKHYISSLFALCLCPIFLSSCSSRLSQAERASVKSVSVLQPVISSKSYKSPYGGSSVPNKVLSQAGGLTGLISDGVGGYFIGGAAGGILGSGVSFAQDSRFKHKNKEHFAILKDGIPEDLSGKIGQEILKQVKSNSFFSDKIQTKSTHQFHTQITQIGLKRIGKKGDKILLSPIISGDVILAGNSDGLIYITATGTAASMAGRTIEEYRAQPSLLEDDYLLAVEEFGRDLRGEINQKTR